MKSKIVWALFGREINLLSAQIIQYYMTIKKSFHMSAKHVFLWSKTKGTVVGFH